MEATLSRSRGLKEQTSLHRRRTESTPPTRLVAEQVAGLPRSRWSRENYLKYVKAEIGLDTTPDHALEEIDPDTVVVNPAWRVINNAIGKQRGALGHLRNR